MAKWKCVKHPTEALEETAKKPTCSKCKNNMFVNEIVGTVQTYDHAGKAAGFGYSKDDKGEVRSGYDFSGGADHKPGGVVYIHSGRKWAISPDGSTHSTGRACWKGFHAVGNQWKYYGSYDGDLNQVNRGGGLQEKTPPKA